VVPEKGRKTVVVVVMVSQRSVQTYPPPFYGYYTGQPALASNPVKNSRILLEQSVTVRMPLLTAASAFGLGRRR